MTEKRRRSEGHGWLCCVAVAQKASLERGQGAKRVASSRGGSLESSFPAVFKAARGEAGPRWARARFHWPSSSVCAWLKPKDPWFLLASGAISFFFVVGHWSVVG